MNAQTFVPGLFTLHDATRHQLAIEQGPATCSVSGIRKSTMLHDRRIARRRTHAKGK